MLSLVPPACPAPGRKSGSGVLSTHTAFMVAAETLIRPLGPPFPRKEKGNDSPAMPRSHASLPRLYVEPALGNGVEVALGKEQSLYLAAVLRKKAGDEVVLFNGRDGAWRCRLVGDAKKAVRLAAVEKIGRAHV